jgi:hypothetical protein
MVVVVVESMVQEKLMGRTDNLAIQAKSSHFLAATRVVVAVGQTSAIRMTVCSEPAEAQLTVVAPVEKVSTELQPHMRCQVQRALVVAEVVGRPMASLER